MSESITLELPAGLIRQARERAAVTHRRLDDAVAEWIGRAVAEPPADAPPDPARLVAQIGTSRPDDAAERRAVLDAEVTPFPPELVAELLAGLRGYIDRNRLSADPETAVAVCSAVRKYVAELPAGRLDEAAGILDTAAGDVPPQLEAEAAKMVVRKFTAQPPGPGVSYPQLAERLTDLAGAYLHPRHLRREYVKVTALNATLALAFLSGDGRADILDRLRRLSVGWFRQQLGRRAGDLLAGYQTRGATVVPDARAWLEQLVAIGRA